MVAEDGKDNIEVSAVMKKVQFLKVGRAHSSNE